MRSCSGSWTRSGFIATKYWTLYNSGPSTPSLSISETSFSQSLAASIEIVWWAAPAMSASATSATSISGSDAISLAPFGLGLAMIAAILRAAATRHHGRNRSAPSRFPG
jgi:hypothetical protein